jgi:hypothetical protein
VTRWIEAQGDDMAATLRRQVPAGLRLEARTTFARAQFDVGVDQ